MVRETGKVLMVEVESRKVLDLVSEIIDCYTRPDSADDLVIDSVFLEDPVLRGHILGYANLTEKEIHGMDYIVLWV